MHLVRVPGPALTLAVAVLALNAAAAPADIEPNDHLVQAEALSSGGPFFGQAAGDSDTDLYMIYVSGPAQLDIAVSVHGGGSDNCVQAVLFDGDYNAVLGSISSVYTVDGTEHIRYPTAAGATSYVLAISGTFYCAAGDYNFSVAANGGQLVSGPGFPAAQAVPEPNESADHAYGPLSGATPYGDSLQTANDADWMYFYTAPGTQQLDISVTGTISCGNPQVTVFEHRAPDSGIGGSVDAQQDTMMHIRFTSPAAARYDIQITPDVGDDGCPGDPWRLQIDPSSALRAVPPAGAPAGSSDGNGTGTTSDANGTGTKANACAAAKRKLRMAGKALARARRALRHAHAAAARRRAARKLKRAKHAYAAAQRHRRKVC
jgi:hypothetical protein